MNASIELIEAKKMVEELSFSDASMALLGERALQRRVDTKFIFPLHKLKDILAELTGEYALVRAAGEPVAQYRTLYFDTEDHRCLRAHHRGRRPRYKIRVRHYIERELSYLEIKQKVNANTTAKFRHSLPYGTEELGEVEHAFIDAHTPMDPQQLAPSLRTDFGRLTLLGVNTMERATFDVDLCFAGPKDRDGFPHLVIAEIKQDRFRPRSPLMLAFRRAVVRPRSVSKYCTAALLLLPNLTLNRFYPILRSIRKTCHD